MIRTAYIGAEVFDGTTLHQNMAFLLEADRFFGIVPRDAVPVGWDIAQAGGGTILPGFVDLQVNGGGGVMFNDFPSVATLETIAAAHARTGTRALLPTLITDTPERTRAAIQAVFQAIARGVPGILGIHLEGPHLSIARKGAHDPALIRPMLDADVQMLCDAAAQLPNVLATVAPENVTLAQIARLRAAGVIVSLGHTDCSFDTAQAAFDAGAACVTHLFNAMSQLSNREPGLVGATLANGAVSAGLIADNIHVHAASIRIALAAKTGPGGIFLVTDAMATAGSEIDGFQLNGRRVQRSNGRLTLEDGTLAGADLEFPRALSVLENQVGIDRETALAMATSIPAACLRAPRGFGTFSKGCVARPIILTETYQFQPLSPSA